MQIDKKETVKQVYRFLKSYHSLIKLSLDGQDGAFRAKDEELVGVIDVYKDNLDDLRREIFANPVSYTPHRAHATPETPV